MLLAPRWRRSRQPGEGEAAGRRLREPLTASTLMLRPPLPTNSLAATAWGMSCCYILEYVCPPILIYASTTGFDVCFTTIPATEIPWFFFFFFGYVVMEGNDVGGARRVMGVVPIIHLLFAFCFVASTVLHILILFFFWILHQVYRHVALRQRGTLDNLRPSMHILFRGLGMSQWVWVSDTREN